MGFYEDLSDYYDEVFPVNPAELAFARGLTEGKERLLDIGCGTGNKTVVFAEGKRETVGIDLDAEMIARAERDNAGPHLRYLVLDMLALDREFGPGSFDCALCLGNSLAHLVAPPDLDALFRGVARVLAPGGVFVVQILNYDRILDRGVTELPVIETDSVLFTRKYAFRDGALHFLTELTVKKRGEAMRNDIVLRPVRKHELEAAFTRAGFTGLRLFGGYAGTEWAPDSFHLIARGNVK